MKQDTDIITIRTENARSGKNLVELMFEFTDDDAIGMPEVPVGALAHEDVDVLLAEANRMDDGQSMNAQYFGTIAMRETLIRYYDGDVDRALATLETAEDDAIFTRAWMLAEAVGLDRKPKPWGVGR